MRSGFLILCIAVLGAAPVRAAEEKLTVFAAASLTEVVQAR